MKVHKINRAHLARVAKAYGVKVVMVVNSSDPHSLTVAQLVGDLQARLAEAFPEDDVLECSRCGFESPDTIELPTCPGCGVAFGSPAQEHGRGEPEMQQAKAEVVDISAQAPGNGADQPEKPVRKASATKRAEKQKEDREASDAEIREAEAKAKKRLEQIGKAIDKELGTQAGSAWRIGKHLSEVYKMDLWKSDPGEDYKSFADFAQRRFQFGKDTARGYLRIAETFSEEEAATMSVSRLWWLARVEDPKERQQLADQVKSGKIETVRDLIEKVKVKRAEAGLKTERKGLEGTVSLSGRIKAGATLAEGEFAKKGKKLVFDFEMGGQTFTVVTNEEDLAVEVRHKVKK